MEENDAKTQTLTTGGQSRCCITFKGKDFPAIRACNCIVVFVFHRLTNLNLRR